MANVQLNPQIQVNRKRFICPLPQLTAAKRLKIMQELPTVPKELPIYSQGQQVGVYKLQTGQAYFFPVLQNQQLGTVYPLKNNDVGTISVDQPRKHCPPLQIHQILVDGRPVPFPFAPNTTRPEAKTAVEEATPEQITLHIPAAESVSDSRDTNLDLGEAKLQPQQTTKPNALLRPLLVNQETKNYGRPQKQQFPVYCYQVNQNRVVANQVEPKKLTPGIQPNPPSVQLPSPTSGGKRAAVKLDKTEPKGRSVGPTPNPSSGVAQPETDVKMTPQSLFDMGRNIQNLLEKYVDETLCDP